MFASIVEDVGLSWQQLIPRSRKEVTMFACNQFALLARMSVLISDSEDELEFPDGIKEKEKPYFTAFYNWYRVNRRRVTWCALDLDDVRDQFEVLCYNFLMCYDDKYGDKVRSQYDDMDINKEAYRLAEEFCVRTDQYRSGPYISIAQLRKRKRHRTRRRR